MDFWQNVLSLAIQFFLVSRIFKYLGIGGALFVLPVLALGSYTPDCLDAGAGADSRGEDR